MPHADEHNNTGSKLPRPAVLHADEDTNTTPMLTIQAVPHADEDNNDGSKANNPLVSNTSDNNVKEGKNDVDREEGSNNVATYGIDGRLAASKTYYKNPTSDSGGIHDIIKDSPSTITHGGRGSGKGKGNDKGKGKGPDVINVEVEHALHIWTERERRKKMKNMFNSLHSLLPQLPKKADKATVVGEAVTYIKTLEGTIQRLEKLKKDRKRLLAEQQLAVGAGGSSSTAPASSSSPAPMPSPATREAMLADMVQSWNTQDALMTELRAAASAVVTAGAGGISSSSAPRGMAPAPRGPAGPAPVLARAPAMQTWSGRNIVMSVTGKDAVINLSTSARPGMMSRLLYVMEKHRVSVVSASVASDQSQRMFCIHARITAPAPPQLPANVTIEDRYKMAVAEMLHVAAI
nr:unnamed protein product [Digitaria exilis]